MSKKVVVAQPQPQVGFAHVFANEVSEIVAIIRPFVVWPLLAIGATLLHHFWAANLYAVSFLWVSCVLICALVWQVSEHLKIPQFIHTVATSVLVAAILSSVDLFGWNKLSTFAVLMVIPMICLTWSIRGAIYEREQAKGQHLNSFLIRPVFRIPI